VVSFYGTVKTGALAPAEVEWIFEAEGDCIRRLRIHLLNA
jgi:hypothetical protein